MTPPYSLQANNIVERANRKTASTLKKLIDKNPEKNCVATAVLLSLEFDIFGFACDRIRYSFKVGCLMYFEHYPFDKQKCVFSMALMSSTDSEVNLNWDKEYGTEAILFFKEIEPLQFKLGRPVTHMDVITYNGANYTYLYFDINLVRRLTGSFINIFAPSTLVVAVSWVNFWIKVDAAPARVSLSITSLLTLCTQMQQNKSQLPPLNYITAVDIWLFVCILMVFCTLIEFAFCYNSYSEHKGRSEKTKFNNNETNSRSKSKRNPWMEPQKSDAIDFKKELKKFPKQFTEARIKCSYCRLPCNGSELDMFCRKLFPLSFVVFVVSYWVYFLNIYHHELN
ncbi:glutamate-gated chloride channel alpha [Nephila pilipes]|uniref:Glutamate-gated chloride channel alpha n=1 Tax=Nephila pilipes TaxID=299642 RepID=A0A8X6J2Q6_NEPPI|nr:glutamate-gated chloride channel alpha [Nephila pilipes]